MTRDDVFQQLRAVLNDEINDHFGLEVVGDSDDGGLLIEADGKRFSLDIRALVSNTLRCSPQVSAGDESVRQDSAWLTQMIAEGYESAEKDGLVPPEELRCMVEEAKERGLKQRALRLQNKKTVQRAG